ncbi:glutaminyl-peptide cyclotransferase [Daejeonella sp.]|jgi:glutamine cyclotransferase|uniref:glutaminyl-peptide cyclotransferase n=1 Tax=Daejeonella sp. TaxID=2805397 RepID=UPI00378452AD
MRHKLIYLSYCTLFLLTNCSNGQVEHTSAGSHWLSPLAGTSVNLGDSVNLQLSLSNKADSIVFFTDGIKLGNSKGESALHISTSNLSLGIKTIGALVYRGNEEPEEISTNIVVKSTLVPQTLKYSVQATFNHDTSSYTQGLEYYKGFLYESDGLLGESSIRKTEISTGKVLQLTKISDEIFAEGITIVEDKIFMLTYRNAINLEFELNSLKFIRQFPVQYQREGWGLCNDGKVIYSTDGTNSIYVLNKDTYMQERAIEVYDHKGPVYELNELEFVDGMIYANIYNSNRIVIIDPATGQVKAEVDLSNLYPDSSRSMKDFDGFVLNGIAWDSKAKRLFVTGKKWDKLFQIKLSAQ